MSFDDALATADECRVLYDLMKDIKKLAPWDWMEETDIFGVRHPDTGETGFISVMGMAGEHYAISVYLGAEGIYGFEAMQRRGPYLAPEDVLEVPQLQASFEDREMLEKRDRDQIKKLERRYRGRNAWPMFRDYRPGYAPWFITSEQVPMLRCALEQLLEVAPRVADDPDLLLTDADNTYLVREQNDSGEWVDTEVTVAPPEPRKVPVRVDSSLVDDAKKLRRSAAILQATFFMVPFPIGDPDEGRMTFSYGLLLLDPSAQQIAGMQLVQPEPTIDDMLGNLFNTTLELLIEYGKSPRSILVASDRLENHLQPLKNQLKINVKRRNQLREIEAARQSLLAYLSQQNP
jgi:hypothetical protein